MGHLITKHKGNGRFGPVAWGGRDRVFSSYALIFQIVNPKSEFPCPASYLGTMMNVGRTWRPTTGQYTSADANTGSLLMV